MTDINRRIRSRSYTMLLSGIAFVTYSNGASAQALGETATEAPPQNSPESAARENEIVVTATRRAVGVQDAPLSLTVITDEEIQARGVEDFSDYARGVPGLSFQTSRPGQTRIALRGIPNLGNGATVSFYVDETPITTDDNRTSATDPAILDIERIEVLRGPQGTLYGASSMGGTIRIITAKPDLNDFLAQGGGLLSSTRYGGTNYGVQGMLNIPLVNDRIALRISGFYRKLDGYIDRIPLPQVQNLAALTPAERTAYAEGADNINESEIFSIRASLQWEIGDLTISPSAFLTRNDYRNQPGVDAAYGGELVNTLLLDENSLDQNNIYNLTLNYAFSWGTLTSATSYVDRTYGGRTDTTRFLGDAFGNSTSSAFDFGTDIGIFTQEVRLASTGQRRLDFLFGIFYSEFEEDAFADFATPGWSAAVGVPVAGDVFFRKAATRDYYERALFGELTYNVNDRLHITAGVRAYQGRRSFVDIDQGLFNGGRTTVNQASGTYDGYNPKFLVSYDLAEDFLLYATAAKGYRAGGANTVPPTTCAADLAALGLTAAPRTFSPDSLWNYELGARTQWLDGRLTVNASAYLIKWQDIQFRQRLAACGFGFLTNGDQATSRGFEIEFSFRPTRNVSLSGGLGYADATLDQASSNIPGSVAGSRIPGVPDLTFNVAALFTPRLSRTLEGMISLTYQYSAAFRDDLLVPGMLNQRSSVNDVGLRAGLSGRNWNASLFVDNLLDDRSIVGSNNFGPTIQWVINRPRTVGARAGIEF